MSAAIDEAMGQAVERGAFPAASLLVARGGEILHHAHYGKAAEGICFDIASLTKPVCTAALVMLLVQEKKLKLSDTLYQWLGGARQPEHKKITVEHLLNHTSGLTAWRPFFREVPSRNIGTPEAEQQIVEACLKEPTRSPPGALSEYSDLGYILLGKIVEEAGNQSLDQLFKEKIAAPFDLKETLFIRNIEHRLPAGSLAGTPNTEHRFAPTEDCPWRDKVIKGEVHDQNAFAMGGVAGHAGLFSTTNDLHKFTKEFLKHHRSEIIGSWKLEIGNYVLGWDTPTFGSSSAGRYFSPRSIGHLGYTGCSIWIDLEKYFWVILLTNRIHPSTANEKIKSFRPRIHNLICRQLF